MSNVLACDVEGDVATAGEQGSSDSVGDFLTPFRGQYRLDERARNDAFAEGLVVFGTNALLDLYRFSADARGEFLNLIEAVRERVFVPFQVAAEFHERRTEAVDGRTQEFVAWAAEALKRRNETRGLVRRLVDRARAQGNLGTELETTIEHAFEEVAAFIEGLALAYDLDPDQLALTPAEDDPIVVQLAPILDGRVGRQPPADLLERDRREYDRRAEAGIPPGFSDKGKSSNRAGDYLWWAETLRHAAAAEWSSVIIVSNDVSKGDWVLNRRGNRIGPHPYLVNEMHETCSAELHWATTLEFLEGAPKALGARSVSSTTLAQAREVPDEQPTDEELEAAVEAILGRVRSADEAVAAASVAHAARRVVPSLPASGWAGTGSFSRFLAEYTPELVFIGGRPPGYVLDPEIHADPAIVSDAGSEADDQEPELLSPGWSSLVDLVFGALGPEARARARSNLDATSDVAADSTGAAATRARIERILDDADQDGR